MGVIKTEADQVWRDYNTDGVAGSGAKQPVKLDIRALFGNIDSLLAYLNSPPFVGNPTAPTQAVGNNSTRLANTAFVQAALAGAPIVVPDGSITFAKMQDIASDRLIGRDTALAGDPEQITVGGGVEFTGLGGIQRSALTGDVTAPAGSGVTTLSTNAVITAKIADLAVTTIKIADDAVTFAKIQNLNTDRLLGRDTAAVGSPEELTVGGGIEFTGLGGIQRSALTGDVTAAAGVGATVIANLAVTTGKLADLAVSTAKIADLGVTSAKIADKAVGFTKLQDINTDRLIGRDTAAIGNPQEITVTGGLEWTGLGGIQRAALSGDVIAPAGSNALTIPASLISPFGRTLTAAIDQPAARTVLGISNTPDSPSQYRQVKNTGAAAYAPIIGDEGSLITLSRATAATVTMPADVTQAFTIGQWIDFMRTGAGIPTFVPGAGAILNAPSTLLRPRAQWSLLRAIKQAVNVWVLTGDLDQPAPPAPFTVDYLEYHDERAAGTDGGTFTSGAWQTRVLNVEHADAGNHGALAANQITFDAGTYECLIFCPGYLVGTHQARLYNVTDAIEILPGSPCAAGTGSGVSSASIISGRFTLAAVKALAVQHRCITTRSTDGYGTALGIETEVYTQAKFWKVA